MRWIVSTCLERTLYRRGDTSSLSAILFFSSHFHLEGVLVAKKDNYSVWSYKSPEGDKDLALPNLEVVNLMKSLKSSGYVKETFNWCV